MDNQDKPKGFKGLSKLVSDLSDLPRLEPPREEARLDSARSDEKGPSRPVESGNWAPDKGDQESSANSEDALGTGGILIFGFIVLLVIGAVVANNQSQKSASIEPSESQSPSTSRSANQNPQGASVSDSSIDFGKDLENPEGQSRIQLSNSAEVQRFSTSVPPVGTNHVHSISEIRWCLAEGIRIDAVRSFNETQADVDEFNRWVDDYNSRCGSYRYRQGNLASARQDVERYRSVIQEEARAKAAAEKQQKAASLTKEVQLALKSLGYEPGPADGIYGVKTANAIEQYQRENNLWVTGKVSEELLEQLIFTKAIR